MNLINKRFVNSEGYEFEVLELERIDENFKKYYTVKFIETEFIANNVRSDTIKNGLVRDKLRKTLVNTGIVGYANTREDLQKYKLWSNMIRRCYDINDKSYKYYGDKKVTVSERWQRYDYFLEDIEKIEGWDKELFHNKQLKLDKDIKSHDCKIYSLQTCTFVSDIINQKQRAKEQNLKNAKVAIFPDGHEEVIENVTDFCKLHILHRSNVGSCLRKEYTNHKGFKFYYQ